MNPRRPAERTRDATRSLREALRALPRAAADEAFTARVLARLDQTPGPAAEARTGPRNGIWLGAWVLGGLATAALAVAVGSAVLRPATDRAADRAAETRVAEVPDAVTVGPRTALPGLERAERTAAVELRGAAPESAPAASPPAAPEASSVTAASPPDTASAIDPSPASRRRALLAEVRSDLDALRREHRQLAAGLADLPEIGADGRPVIYVGGDEGLGLVLAATDRGTGGSASYPGGGASL